MDKLFKYKVEFKFNKFKVNNNTLINFQLYQGSAKWAGDKQMWEISAEDISAESPNDSRKIKYYPTIEALEESWIICNDDPIPVKPHQLVSIEYRREKIKRRNIILQHKNKKLDHKRLKLLYLANLLTKEKVLFPFSNMYIKCEGKGHLFINKNNVALLIKDAWNKLNTSSQEDL